MARIIHGAESAPALLLWVSERCLDYKVEAREIGISPPNWPEQVILQRDGRAPIVCHRTGCNESAAWYWVADMTGRVYIEARGSSAQEPWK